MSMLQILQWMSLGHLGLTPTAARCAMLELTLESGYVQPHNLADQQRAHPQVLWQLKLDFLAMLKLVLVCALRFVCL